MMRRVLRWLWRQFCTVAMVGTLLLGCAVGLFAAAPAATVSEPAFSPQTPRHGLAALPPGHTPRPSLFGWITAAFQHRFAGEAHLSGGPQTPEERARAQQRARESRWLSLGSTLYQAALVIGLLLAGGTRWLARVSNRLNRHWLLGLGAVLGILTLAGTLLTFPLDYYGGFVFQHKYGLSNQTFLAWLRDYLLGEGVGLVLSVPLIGLLYAVLRKAPRTWWLWMAALSLPVSLFFMLIYPVFVAPLFNTFTRLQNPELRQDLLSMAHQQGIPANDVFQVDASRQSKAVNAYVNGVGPTQRIVLYDTLLADFTDEEIKFVLAHEMGHYKLGHIRDGILLSVLGSLVGGALLYGASRWVLGRYGDRLGFRELGHPASYPLLVALGMALSFIAFPLGNAYSRYIERQADAYAVQVYPNRAAGISAFHKLARINIAEENPPRWVVALLYSHPSIGERIRVLEAGEAAGEDR